MQSNCVFANRANAKNKMFRSLLNYRKKCALIVTLEILRKKILKIKKKKTSKEK